MAPIRQNAAMATGVAFALFGLAAAGAPTQVQSAPSADMQLPNCNSYASVLAYLSTEVYYGKHPYNNPAYGQWNVPCDPAKPDKLTNKAFPADFITCSPNILFTHGNDQKNQDRMFACIQKKQCSITSTATKVGGIGEGTISAGGDATVVLVSDAASIVPLDVTKTSPVSDADFSNAFRVGKIASYLSTGAAGGALVPKTAADVSGQIQTEFSSLKQKYADLIAQTASVTDKAALQAQLDGITWNVNNAKVVPDQFGAYSAALDQAAQFVDVASAPANALSPAMSYSDMPELQDYNGDHVGEKNAFSTWYSGAGFTSWKALCGERYIVFSGTDDGSDALTDANIWPPTSAYNTVWHAGFLQEFQQFRAYVDSLWKPVNRVATSLQAASNYQAIFAGHSLGGGIAQIAATYVKNQAIGASVPVQYFTIGGAAAVFDNTNWNASPWDNIPAHRYVNTKRGCKGSSNEDEYFQDPVPTLGLSIPLTARHTQHNSNGAVFLYANEVTGQNNGICWHWPRWAGQCGMVGCGWPFYSCTCPGAIGCSKVTEYTCNGSVNKSYGGSPSGWGITEFSLHSSTTYLKNINELYNANPSSPNSW